jgi:hypothetical protein
MSTQIQSLKARRVEITETLDGNEAIIGFLIPWIHSDSTTRYSKHPPCISLRMGEYKLLSALTRQYSEQEK